eukprot:6704986-Pyramimonas_sp.AAC.1
MDSGPWALDPWLWGLALAPLDPSSAPGILHDPWAPPRPRECGPRTPRPGAGTAGGGGTGWGGGEGRGRGAAPIEDVQE